MKLYYDTLIAYMPDAVRDENGAMIHSNTLAAGRGAMSELAEFQITGNIMSLYQAVIFACRYAGQDLIESITTVIDTMEVSVDATVTELLDESAMILFKSINSEKYPFDLNRFLANLLAAEHLVYVTIQRAKQQKSQEADNG